MESNEQSISFARRIIVEGYIFKGFYWGKTDEYARKN